MYLEMWLHMLRSIFPFQLLNGVYRYFHSPNCIKDIRSKISKDLLTGGQRTVDQLDAH
jgi:hypothetical protein